MTFGISCFELFAVCLVIGRSLHGGRTRPGLLDRLRSIFVMAGWGSLGAWLLSTPVLIAQFNCLVLLGTLVAALFMATKLQTGMGGACDGFVEGSPVPFSSGKKLNDRGEHPETAG